MKQLPARKPHFVTQRLCAVSQTAASAHGYTACAAGEIKHETAPCKETSFCNTTTVCCQSDGYVSPRELYLA